jgi:hypothetical protein
VLLTALAVLYLSNTASWLVDLAHPSVDLEAAGFPADKIQAGGEIATLSGLPGGVLATAACILLALLGLLRALAALSPDSHADRQLGASPPAYATPPSEVPAP